MSSMISDSLAYRRAFRQWTRAGVSSAMAHAMAETEAILSALFPSLFVEVYSATLQLAQGGDADAADSDALDSLRLGFFEHASSVGEIRTVTAAHIAARRDAKLKRLEASNAR